METVKPSNPKVEVPIEDEKSLKGTMISVGIVLAFITASWIAVFSLFMSRV